MRRAATSAALAALALVACELPPTDEHATCDVGARVMAVQAADRKIIGLAAAYPGDGALPGVEDALHSSQRMRRELGWRVAARVIAPVALAEPLPGLPGHNPTMPAWQTWYGGDDVNRLFHRLYQGLDPEQRRARVRFSDPALDQALAWNTRAVEELPNWPEQRWLDYVASVDEVDEVAGLGGIARVGYSPEATRHMLASYPDIIECVQGGVPDRFVDAPAHTRRQAREPIALATCEERAYGPYFVAGGATLRAGLDGADVGGAAVHIRAQGSEPERACDSAADEPCLVTGPGVFHVSVTAGPGGLDATLTVDYDEPQAAWSACLASAFPFDAALIKADWRRAQFGQLVPVYDTSGDALASRLAPGGELAWGDGDALADPGPDEIFTIQLPNSNVYRLAGLHIMTKELDHWVWVTLWWSAEPDRDFGADRPDDIAALGGPWDQYKMCVVTAFDERDPDPTGGFEPSAPSLANALAAVHAGVGGPSWCSNPYIERGAGNAATNCMGCHQHGGTALTGEQILADPGQFPASGRTELRNNFPTDYLWAITDGDELGPMFEDIAAFYDQGETVGQRPTHRLTPGAAHR